jgi:hypothetical protein
MVTRESFARRLYQSSKPAHFLNRSFRQVTPIWYKPFRFSIGNMSPAMHHSAISSAGTTRQISLLPLTFKE